MLSLRDGLRLGGVPCLLGEADSPFAVDDPASATSRALEMSYLVSLSGGVSFS